MKTLIILFLLAFLTYSQNQQNQQGFMPKNIESADRPQTGQTNVNHNNGGHNQNYKGNYELSDRQIE
jgi:hypothetical protein